VRILTLNQGKGSVIASALIRLLERQQIQIVCFQEQFDGKEGVMDPVLEQYFSSRGWHRTQERSIASRLPIVEELPPLEDADAATPFWRARVSRARLRAPSGAVFAVASVHMPSMYYAFVELEGGHVTQFNRHIAWRARRMGLVAAGLGKVNDLPLLVGGDFNMPSESTLMSTLQPVGLSDAFDAAGWGFGYTRPATFPWVRIDHILGGPEWTFTRCWAGPNVGSDHLPLCAEAVLTEPPAGAAPKAADNAPRPSPEGSSKDAPTSAPPVPKPAEIRQSPAEETKKTENPP
jgi:endonuclease/exonuclease/phosphatase (EEP) superfamily protein YafD